MHPRMKAAIERRQMAEHISDHQPLTGDEIRAALGWGFQQFFDAVHSWPDRWFVMTAGGWELTEYGRAALDTRLNSRNATSLADSMA
jgi:hypothetical protein